MVEKSASKNILYELSLGDRLIVLNHNPCKYNEPIQNEYLGDDNGFEGFNFRQISQIFLEVGMKMK